MTAIEVDGLTVRYDLGGGVGLTAVDHIDITADRGEVVVLLGPNGAGKTTTVEALVGFRTPTEGSVRVLGLDPAANHDRLMAEVGVMFQEGGVHTGIRPLEALQLYAAFYADPLDPEELLERLGLHERRRSPWRRLSGGEKQRLSLGLAMIGRPKVAFLDEPTAGVDVDGRRLVRDLVADLRAQNTCVLLTTHDLAEAEQIADRVVIIDRGLIVADDSLANLTKGPGAAIRFVVADPLDTVALGTHLDALVVATSDGRYRAEIEPTPGNIARLTGWLAAHDIAVGELDGGGERLEDVFLRLTGRAS